MDEAPGASRLINFWIIVFITVFTASYGIILLRHHPRIDPASLMNILSGPWRFTIPLLALTILLTESLISHFKNSVVIGFTGVMPATIKLKPGHIVVYGRTGSGKSNTTKILISKCSRRIPVLILDWHGEYLFENFKKLTPGDNFTLNPLDYQGSQLSEHIDFLVDLFGDVYRFSEPQRFMFRKVLKQLYGRTRTPSLNDFLTLLEETPIKSYYDHEIKMALKRRMFGLIEGRAGKALSKNSTINVETLFGENVIIDLSVFRSLYIKRLFVMILLKMLYDHVTTVRGLSDEVKHITVIEEAWNVIPYRRLDAEPTIGERLFAELRKHGELIIAVTQFPTETAWSIMKNARLLLIHRLPSREVEFMKLTCKADTLHVGHAYLVEDEKIRKIRIKRFRDPVHLTRSKPANDQIEASTNHTPPMGEPRRKSKEGENAGELKIRIRI